MSKKCELEHVAKAICNTKKFEYVQFIDAGAFKETYQVKDRINSYALKVFKANNSSERTDREIDVMRRTSCPNIAKLIEVDSFIFNNVAFLYLLEEYLAGGSLGSLLKKSLLSKAEVISLGNDMLNALESTKSNRIVHRDIKPDNIMFRGVRSEAVLVDFGLVRDLDATSLTKAFHMRGPGTPLYSAPEQLNNNKALIDWRTDQFSLGITLCVAILGDHPFESGSAIKTVERVASMTTCNETTVNSISGLGLKPLIQMLEPYPIKRYRTPGQLKNDWGTLEGMT